MKFDEQQQTTQIQNATAVCVYRIARAEIRTAADYNHRDWRIDFNMQRNVRGVTI
jgi:hypothetical protein